MDEELQRDIKDVLNRLPLEFEIKSSFDGLIFTLVQTNCDPGSYEICLEPQIKYSIGEISNFLTRGIWEVVDK